MSINEPVPFKGIVARSTVQEDTNAYVDWSAVIAGIVLASAISIVMLEFGSAIGLSFISFSTKGYALGAGVGVALWFLWVQISGFMAGAYLTGRLRRPAIDKTEHEVEVRDGAHGLLVWAGGTIIGAFLPLNGATWVANSAGSVAKSALETAAVADPASMQYYSETLLRSAPQGVAAPASAPRISTSEINTILAKSALAAPIAEDKAYLAQVVSSQTGLGNADAKVRVDNIYATIEIDKAEASKLADKTRRMAIIAAFLLAASTLVSAAAAYWAAGAGGSHRKDAVVFTGFFRRQL